MAQFLLRIALMHAEKGHAGTSLTQTPDHDVQRRDPTKAAILIVDDDEPHRVMMRRLLQRAGFLVLEAPNGEHAHQYLAEHTHALPALVIVDGQMPVMDGWELVVEMQNDPRLASVPVIMVSGTQGRTAAGLRAFFPKPFDPSRLLAAVDEHAATRLSAA